MLNWLCGLIHCGDPWWPAALSPALSVLCIYDFSDGPAAPPAVRLEESLFPQSSHVTPGESFSFTFCLDSCVFKLYLHVLFPQAAEGLYCHTRSSLWNHGGLLEDALGAQLHHRGDADETQRDGTGESTPLSLWQILTFMHSEQSQCLFGSLKPIVLL